MGNNIKEIFAVAMLSILAVGGTGYPDGVELEQIIVTPSRIQETQGSSSRNVDIISSDDLRTLNPSDISEALKGLTSVSINNYGSLGAQKTISMRGSTESQVLVLIDGRPLNSPRSGYIDLSAIPLDSIERIEVMRGPASSVYGSSAMGGVVNIITKQPPSDARKTELISSIGTFGTYDEKFSYGEKVNNLGYLFNAGLRGSEGHRDNSEFGAKDAGGKITYEFEPENIVAFNTNFYKDKLGTPGLVTSPDPNDTQMNTKNFLDLSWDVLQGDARDFGFFVRAYQNYERLEFIETPEPLDKTTHATKAIGMNLRYAYKMSELYRLICGFDWTGNINDSTATLKHEYIIRAGYLENKFNILDNLGINLGVRLDDYSNFGTEVSPSANLAYSLKDDTKFHFLLARSFRAPTFNDLYWPATGFAEGNPSLGPEKGITGEFGIDRTFSRFFEAGLIYFRNDYNNLIKWQEDSDGVWRPKNISSAIINGLEQSFTIRPCDRLGINLNYTYLKATDDKTDRYLTYQPKQRANFNINYKGLAGFNAGLGWQLMGGRYHNAANTIYLKRYYVLDLRFSKDIEKNTTLFLNIDNLLNKKYQYIRNYPLPGFAVTCGLKLEF